MSREGQKLDSAAGAGGVGIGVLSLDLLGQVLDRLREPRDRKACRLVSRAFERAEAAHRRALRVLRREPLPRLLRAFPVLERLDLSACASLNDALLAAAIVGAGEGLAGVPPNPPPPPSPTTSSARRRHRPWNVLVTESPHTHDPPGISDIEDDTQ